LNPFILITMRQLDNPFLFNEEELSNIAEEAESAIECSSANYHEAAANASYAIDAYIDGFEDECEFLSSFFNVTGESLNLYYDEVERLR